MTLFRGPRRRRRYADASGSAPVFDLATIPEPAINATPVSAFRFFDLADGPAGVVPDYYEGEDLALGGGDPQINDGFLESDGVGDYLTGVSTSRYSFMHDGSTFIVAFTFKDLAAYASGNHFLFGTQQSARGFRVLAGAGQLTLYSDGGTIDATSVALDNDNSIKTVLCHINRTNRDVQIYINGVLARFDGNHHNAPQVGDHDAPLEVGRHPNPLYSQSSLIDLRFYLGQGSLGADGYVYHEWATLQGLTAPSFAAAYAARDLTTHQQAAARAAVEAQIRTILNNNTHTGFGLTLKSSTGNYFKYGKGELGSDVRGSTNSCNKPVAVAAMLYQVEQGRVALTDKMIDYVGSWNTDAVSGARDINLEHCVNYQTNILYSGTRNQDTWADIVADVEAIPGTHDTSGGAVGVVFEYLTGQLDMGGVLVVERHPTAADWEEVQQEFWDEHSLFGGATMTPIQGPDAAPSDIHNVTCDEYVEFLWAIQQGTILTPALRALMTDDQMAHISAKTFVHGDIGEDWHYGAGFWREARADVFSEAATEHTCTFGAGGQYGRLPDSQSYVGYVSAVQGPASDQYDGANIFRSIETLVEQWGVLP